MNLNNYNNMEELLSQRQQEEDLNKKLYMNMKNKIWTTKDGREIHVTEMSDNHLNNLINLFYKQGFIGIKMLKTYLNGPGPMIGDAALDAFNFEFDDIISKEPTEWIDILEEEKERRETNNEG